MIHTDFFKESFYQGCRIFFTIFKITFPILIVLFFCDHFFNLTAVIGDALSPIMGIVGLPGETGIVFATALLLNIYSALLVFVGIAPALDLSTAQVTVLMTMILVAHALPVEIRIVQMAGVRPLFIFCLRFFGSFAMGYALLLIYSDQWLQETATYYLNASTKDDTFWQWLQSQATNWLIIFGIIQVLVLMNEGMKKSNIEAVLIRFCTPFFRLIGIGEKAITMALIGMLLGLSYGGGFLIEHGRRGDINQRDILCVLSLLCLCHSIIEDTLVVMVVGAHFSGVLIARTVFSLVFMMGFTALIKKLSNNTLNRFFVIPSRRA